MNKLIEMIEAEYTNKMYLSTAYCDGLRFCLNILRPHPGLWLEEITEEEAKKEQRVIALRITDYYGVAYETVKWRDEWRDVFDDVYINVFNESTGEPRIFAKFYRLPQAKEEKCLTTTPH